MSPKLYVLIWLGQLLLLVMVYSVLCALAPDTWLYDIYTSRYGFLTEEEWYDRYIPALMILSVFITTLLILVIALFRHPHKKY
jgi:hypothetical protein